MAQMTKEHAERIAKYGTIGKHSPLTAWEVAQLAHGWLQWHAHFTAQSINSLTSYDLGPAQVEGKLREKLIEMGWTPPGQVRTDLTPELFGSWCNLLTHAHMYITERSLGNAQLGIEDVLKGLREWQARLTPMKAGAPLPGKAAGGGVTNEMVEQAELAYVKATPGMNWPSPVGIRAAIEAAQAAITSFQDRVGDWMRRCFEHSLYGQMIERGDRVAEEVFEMLQAHHYPRERLATLIEYVYNRPLGEPEQEVGGVMITLSGFCHVAGHDMMACGERELARINTPEVMAKIRAKQKAKNALHFDTPLPGAAGMEHAP